MKLNDESMKKLGSFLISVRAVGDKIYNEIETMYSTLNAEFIRR